VQVELESRLQTLQTLKCTM